MMPDDAPHFDDAGRLIAPRYDDVYFSAEDGLAETRHVFINGNNLAERFAAMQPGACFTIGETGFGTGLNFFAAWQLFDQVAPADARLEFLSVDHCPLDANTMIDALKRWEEIHEYLDALAYRFYSPLWPGTHPYRFAEGRVRLTLCIGEAEQALSGLDASVDAWFLDGFAPSRNPSMWTEEIFNEVARLSSPSVTLATYTAAGHVRRGLEKAGFEVSKQAGFGSKRDMTVAHILTKEQHVRSIRSTKVRTAVVVGGSLAGAFMAHALADRGFKVRVLEREKRVRGKLPSLAPRYAVLQPKIGDMDGAAGRWLREGYALVERHLSPHWHQNGQIELCRTGAFHAAFDERSERRLRRFMEEYGSTGLCRWVEASETEELVGMPLTVGGVMIDRSYVLSPAGVCNWKLRHPNIKARYGVKVESFVRSDGVWSVKINGRRRKEHAEVLVIANAIDAGCFEQTAHLDLRPVRGQVTLLPRPGQIGELASLKCSLFYGGYVGLHREVLTLGASFVPEDVGLDWREEEHNDVCDKLARILPKAADQIRAMDAPSGWVGTRTTTPDHLCYAEKIEPGLYVSLGHGSHGIASAAHAGEHLASLITNGPRARAT